MIKIKINNITNLKILKILYQNLDLKELINPFKSIACRLSKLNF